MIKIILSMMIIFCLNGVVNSTAWSKENKELAPSSEEYLFYPPDSQIKDAPINKEKNWQLFFEVTGVSQFKKNKSVWLNALLGEKTDPDPYIASPMSVVVMEGKAYILDARQGSIWVFNFQSGSPRL